MSRHDDLLDLVDGYLAGTLDGEALADLNRRLIANPQDCRVFSAAIAHDLLLRQQPYAAEPNPPLVAPVAPISRGQAWWRPWRRAASLVASAAALLVLVGGMFLLPRADAPVGHIVSVDAPDGDAGQLHRPDQRSEPLAIGLPIRAGDRVAVALGAAIEVRFSNEDTRLGLGSRTTVRVTAQTDGVHLGLDTGSLVAQVAPQPPGKRLHVATPHSAITVLGTRFCVATRDERTSVEVDHGSVEVSTADAGETAQVAAGERVVADSGKPLARSSSAVRWPDRRPLGVMMLCRNSSGWATNPRGWFGDAKVDTTMPAGLVAFNRRLDEQVTRTIANLQATGAQGVVFWDLEGLEHPPGYVGDPRLLSTLAPEMDAAVDRVMARLRAAGFAVGVTVRTESAERPSGGGLVFRTLSDPVQQVQAKIAYAQNRWGATIFPLLGEKGDALALGTICRRINASSPGVLLVPTGADAETYRWGAPWFDPVKTRTTLAPDEARRTDADAFAVIALLEAPYLKSHHDDLVRAVRAGDVLSFRAWTANPEQQAVRAIHQAAASPAP